MRCSAMRWVSFGLVWFSFSVCFAFPLGVCFICTHTYMRSIVIYNVFYFLLLFIYFFFVFFVVVKVAKKLVSAPRRLLGESLFLCFK